MENNIENSDSTNGEIENQNSQNTGEAQDLENLDANALKEIARKEREEKQKLSETNKHLFERAKRAEGFERDSEGNWVKVEKKTEKKSETKSKKTDELDYGQLAFYNSKSDSVKIESDEDVEFLRQTISDTGKSQAELLKAKWFSSELKERQEAKTVARATPGVSRVAGNSAVNTVDYWISKGQLPDDFELRAKVVDRKIELARQGRLN